MKKFFDSQISFLMKSGALFNVMLGLIISAELFAIGALSYLGTFNRYLADDYCESVAIRNDSVVSAVLHRYMRGEIRASDRYSNLLFVGLSEILGNYRIQVLPSLMMFVWLVGLTWSINQFRRLAGIRLPVMLDFGMAASIIFFSTWQAPNRFQTFYWRSSMATHFVPLVFISLFSGFVLFQINSGKKHGLWTSLIVLLTSFLLGGFSEPPTVVMIVLIALLILKIWLWDDVSMKRSTLNLLAYSLAGFLLAFLAMFFSPGNISHGTASFTNLPVAFLRAFRFTYDFLVDTFRTMPLASLISTLTTFIVFFVFFFKVENQPLKPYSRRQIWMWLVNAPLLQCLFIAASFAPSAYGQSSYPEERAQFLGRLIMTMTLLLEGALLGALCAHVRVLFYHRQAVFILSGLAFFALIFYPLRAGLVLLADVPDYRQWASSWDLRETEIYNSIALGEQDLVVRWLPTRDGIKEIDARTSHWVNRCAAEYYEVDTIRSVPMDNK